MAEKIIKAKESMTAKERVRRTFEFEKTDRVTIGYEANAAVHARLCEALNIRPDDMETLAAIAGQEENVLVLVTCENESAAGGYLDRRVVFAKENKK